MRLTGAGGPQPLGADLTKKVDYLFYWKIKNLLPPLQDRAAKFVDQLSAIGGTMGLLTGFSLISGVEIIYFMVKILWKMLQPKS